MDSLLPMGGFQLPFQRRLSRLYNDTKKSSDFVKEPIQNEEDPEVKALHRKLRIQKDRLVSWGLEWSDPNQSAEIDESLSKAGLSEVVGSIMSTIKDILAEAEPLWQSSKHVVDVSRPSPDRKVPLVQWDKGRFEDLIRDLTASIDTLYDLSRSRSSDYFLHRMSKGRFKSQSTDEFRPFESTRMLTPQQINPGTLTHLQPTQQEGVGATQREVVFMSKTAYSEMTQSTTNKEPWAPLLLEYAMFDSIYSVTGIMPPMSRFEKLSSGLQQDPQRAPGTWTGLPRLLGYFEDMENSRIGLVYRFPPSFNAVSFEGLTKDPLYNLPTLNDLLSRQDTEPPMEAKFRLAYNLTNTIFDMHTRGITHGQLTTENVSFGSSSGNESDAEHDAVDVRRPLVSSFDLFPEDEAAQRSPWRHPLDPRSLQTSSPEKSTDERILELYSLAMVLLSIGLWTKIEDLLPDPTSTSIPKSVLDRLVLKCGTLYMKAVQACWQAVDEDQSGPYRDETLLSRVQMQASRFLETCCILDGVSDLEQRLDQDFRDVSSTPTPSQSFKDTKSPYPADKKLPLPSVGSNQIQVDTMNSAAVVPEGERDTHTSLVRTHAANRKLEVQQELPMKLYPHVPLPPDVVDQWNSTLMPQINHALRHFYRKHLESVEISLESIGPSPQTTQPTVLVVCNSVGKVRGILRKRLSDLFDGATGFPLKVCRGQVVRSRRYSKSASRSMAQMDNTETEYTCEEVEAENPEYQLRPANGASIGAWIGDRHLPPVSFGGLVLVDGKPYGMTVHHMLDDPDHNSEQENFRSSAYRSMDNDFAYDLSDTESEIYSESDITSDYGDDDEEYEDFEQGDIAGIKRGRGGHLVVTQPAFDDVGDDFYPCAETEDEDHLDTYTLGRVYASSGICRKQADGLIHEVDWALFDFDEERLPGNNSISRCGEGAKVDLGESATLKPTAIAPLSSLPGMEVQCMARTSGFRTGQILPTLTSIKISGRCSPSHTYQIASMPEPGHNKSKPTLAMGVPGDSGAWVVDRRYGQLCGHVLAWSQRKQVAYICPMEVLLQDVAERIGQSDVRLPGGEPVVTLSDRSPSRELQCCSASISDDNEGSLDGDDDLPTEFIEDLDQPQPETTHSSPRSIRSTTNHNTSSPLCLERSSELHGLANRLEDLTVGCTQGIGVSG